MREGKAIKMLTYQDAKTAGEAAARWWAGVLQDPKLDNGDDSPMMALLINMSKNEIPGQPSEGLGRFTAILAEELDKRLAEADEYTTRYGISLGVDYGPDATLGDCAPNGQVFDAVSRTGPGRRACTSSPTRSPSGTVTELVKRSSGRNPESTLVHELGSG